MQFLQFSDSFFKFSKILLRARGSTSRTPYDPDHKLEPPPQKKIFFSRATACRELIHQLVMFVIEVVIIALMPGSHLSISCFGLHHVKAQILLDESLFA